MLREGANTKFQSQGIEQINKAVHEIDSVTRQNVEDSEESTDASTKMNAQSEKMREVIAELVILIEGKSGSDGLI